MWDGRGDLARLRIDDLTPCLFWPRRQRNRSLAGGPSVIRRVPSAYSLRCSVELVADPLSKKHLEQRLIGNVPFVCQELEFFEERLR